MSNSIEELASRWLPDAKLSEVERRVLQSALKRRPLSRDVHRRIDEEAKLGERLADTIARVGGSWSFIIAFMTFLLVWALVNVWLLATDAFDPYPFVFLNLILSMLAAVQAPVIMMSQNRQAARDRIDAAHDYEVNLKAEIEIMALHEKMDALRHTEIVAMHSEVSAISSRLAGIEARLSGKGGSPS